jgi:hypothetical protein
MASQTSYYVTFSGVNLNLELRSVDSDSEVGVDQKSLTIRIHLYSRKSYFRSLDLGFYSNLVFFVLSPFPSLPSPLLTLPLFFFLSLGK